MTPRIVWLASYPKSGNTWMRIFLANLINGSSTPIDLNDLISNGSSFSRPMIDDALGFDTGDLTPEECARLRPVVFRVSANSLQSLSITKPMTHAHNSAMVTGQ